MNWELVTTLPPGSPSRTLLGRLAARFAVLRELEGEAAPVDHLVRGLVPLRELTVLGGKRYGVFDVVEAVTLREVIEGFGQLGRLPPLGLVARVVVDAARALSELSPALAHGGLSDSSLLVSFTGATSVMDLGAPRLNRFGLAGPPSFSKDVFSLTAVLHASLTGFSGAYAEALADGVPFQSASQVNPEVAPVLDEVLGRGLSRAAEDRQPDVELLADELEAVLAEALFTPADIATVLGSMLSARRTHLFNLLHGFGGATSSTMPQLGVAAPTGAHPVMVVVDEPKRDPETADDRTGAHLVPWITESAEEQPAGELDHETQPRIELTPPIDPFAPIPMRTQPAAALSLPLEALEGTQPRQRADADEGEGLALADAPLEATQPRAAMPEAPGLDESVADTGPRLAVPQGSAPGTPVPPLVEAADTGPRLGGPQPPARRSPAQAHPVPSGLEAADTGPRLGAPQPPARRSPAQAHPVPSGLEAADTGPRLSAPQPPARRSPAQANEVPALLEAADTGPRISTPQPPARRSPAQANEVPPLLEAADTGPRLSAPQPPARRSPAQAHAVPPLVETADTGPRLSAPQPPPRRSQAQAVPPTEAPSGLSSLPTSPRSSGPRVLQSARGARASRPDAPLDDQASTPEPSRRPSRSHVVPPDARRGTDEVHRAQDTSEQLEPVRESSPGGVRNTTDHERERARGQERIPTPPFGLAAIENEPTQTRRRIPTGPAESEPEEIFSSEVEAIGTSESAAELPPSESEGELGPVDEEPEAETGTDVQPRAALTGTVEEDPTGATAPSRLPRVLILLLVLVVGAMGVGLALKRQGLWPARAPAAPRDEPSEALDAGDVEEPAASTPEEAEVEASDAGEAAAEPEESDAGLVVEAEGEVVVSPVPAKKPAAPSPKKPAPKRRKHR